MVNPKKQIGKYQTTNILSLISDVNPWAINRGMTESINMIHMNLYIYMINSSEIQENERTAEQAHPSSE